MSADVRQPTALGFDCWILPWKIGHPRIPGRLGNRTKEDVFDPTNELTLTRSRVFDALSRLRQDIRSAGTTDVATLFGYDANGNNTSIFAPIDRTTTQAYDELDRLTK